MRVKSELTSLQSENRNLTRVERALNCCAVAKRLEKAGEFGAAAEALNEFWPDSQLLPVIDDLEKPIQAEILLRVGALVGWLGSARQANGSQENAKDLITKSIDLFAEIGQGNGVAEGRSELGLCYWREGAFDEARINLAEALSELSNGDGDLRACVLIRSGMVEATVARWNEALGFYQFSAPIVEKSNDDALKGAYHNSVAATLTELADAQSREDYRDQALIEYAAASIHFEAAGNIRYCALVENNLGFLFSTIGRFKEALKHIDRARGLFSELEDKSSVAQADDTKARALIAAGEFIYAERFARAAVRVLEKGDEHSLLAATLITHGVALSRLGKESPALAAFDRAIDVAQAAGDPETTGRARLTKLEELGNSMASQELISILRLAIDELKCSQSHSIRERLITLADGVLETLDRLNFQEPQMPEGTWHGFSLKRYVHQTERAIIERALRDAAGSVTTAAHLLGYKHHQSLISLINTRHQELESTRSRVRKRRHRIVPSASKQNLSEKEDNVRILHVEDNEAVTNLVSDTLSDENVHLELCANGTEALKTLKGPTPIEVLIVDNDLPGLSGLELVLRCKNIPHRKKMKIIMLSGDDVEKEAWRAGVHEFLRKPKDVNRLTATIGRLLGNKEKDSQER